MTGSQEFFKQGNLCTVDGDTITIIEDYENVEIDNSTVWGDVQRMLNPRGGNIIGNMDNFASRFEIDNDSFNIGSVLRPTFLRIFSKSTSKSHACFDKNSGCLVLGEDRYLSRYSTSILETWGGITHWAGKIRVFDEIAFLPPPDSSLLNPDPGSSTYLSEYPAGGRVHIGSEIYLHSTTLRFTRNFPDANSIFSASTETSVGIGPPEGEFGGGFTLRIPSNAPEPVVPDADGNTPITLVTVTTTGQMEYVTLNIAKMVKDFENLVDALIASGALPPPPVEDPGNSGPA